MNHESTQEEFRLTLFTRWGQPTGLKYQNTSKINTINVFHVHVPVIKFALYVCQQTFCCCTLFVFSIVNIAFLKIRSTWRSRCDKLLSTLNSPHTDTKLYCLRSHPTQCFFPLFYWERHTEGSGIEGCPQAQAHTHTHVQIQVFSAAIAGILYSLSAVFFWYINRALITTPKPRTLNINESGIGQGAISVALLQQSNSSQVLSCNW